jgi:alcohol dehydrogenase
LCEVGAASNTAGTLLSGARRIFRDGGGPINHHMGCSAFAEAAVVSRRSCVKVDSSLPLDEAALFGCAVLTGVGAVVNTAQVRAGSTVAVVGLGGVGLASVLGAVASGARRVVAIDVSDEKLELAASLGATDGFNATDPALVEKVRKATGGGVDFAIEMAGSTRAFETAYRVTRRGGMTVTAGLPHPTATWPLAPTHLVAEERTIKCSYIGTCVPQRDLPRYIDLYRAGKLPVNRLMSGRLTLEGINEGFDRLQEGRAVRQVVSF